MKTPHQILTEAYEYIRDPDHFCQGKAHDYREMMFGPVIVHEPPQADGHKVCAAGAIDIAMGKLEELGEKGNLIARYLNQASTELFPDSKRGAGLAFVFVNDVLGHEAICQVFERAIELAEETVVLATSPATPLEEQVEEIKQKAVTNTSSDDGWFGAPETSAIKIEPAKHPETV